MIGRLAEMRIIDKNTRIPLTTHSINYGSKLYVKEGAEVKRGDLICEWDPYNAVIISESDGKIAFEAVMEGITYREESDEQTGYREKVIIETRDKTKNPGIKIMSEADEDSTGPASFMIVDPDDNMILVDQHV